MVKTIEIKFRDYGEKFGVHYRFIRNHLNKIGLNPTHRELMTFLAETNAKMLINGSKVVKKNRGRDLEFL